MDLLDNLIAIQKSLGLGDRAFARKLGVHPQLWNGTKRGKFALDDTVLAAVLAVFPEMESQIVAYKLSALRLKRETTDAVQLESRVRA